MSDNRETILLRLWELLAVPGIKNVFRDRSEIKRELLPAVVLLDGREELAQIIGPHKSVKMPPALFRMETQIWLALEPRDTKSNETLNGVPAPIGPELSSYRELILDAVINDSHLIALLGANGQMEYRGCETDMAIGASMVGQMLLQFSFTYPVFPSQ